MNNVEIKKAIIPLAGLAIRFLPLSKVASKELWPLVDLPMFHYVIEEARNSGIKELIFVLSPDKKNILDYLKPSPKIEKILKDRKKEEVLEEVKKIEELFKTLSFSYVLQKKPLGDGHAVLQAAKLVNKEPVACLFVDDIIEARTPAVLQLTKIFKTCQKPIIGLYRVAQEKISHYGIVGIEKIANRLFKIKKIIEKPSSEQAPSDLAIVGRYILTPDVFDYLKKAKPNKRGEIILADVFNNQMLRDGKLIYGYELEGEWLECGDKLRWLKSNLYLSLKHPKYGPELKKYLKEI
ncbi:MAG: UTP--glucose-1-phosphate uridylyltransferase [Candidatus Nealsonbacteria bacterium CG10_big_fil_rev_8_21_14_0_10_36_24]|uniref:UTP--glucose-1-phosphate uridylyltransferase n=2 Tax=Candidatus Nealsoniibacteriota TaxID=1817911 RepID=A0A2H0YNT7_9BACT|nr:MAG: UTP--glucose-1-phosphate uridylyltransferase [Candidatus Nealsonbacteria bacterium CG10_big_fil_rev_8_21_14_0_10_36_24]PIS40164.1 MAG: UTP--glucose-1-phosphate uridylyltransferase [Candidatus Nealsonbacteria bacterium CG08_land_8_20_14_0_20_36_22]